jgi:putative membrane protein
MRKTSLVWALVAAGALAGDEGNKGKREAAFIEDAAGVSRAEVRLGQLALAQSTEPSVRQLAQAMVDDHTKANDELKDLCGTRRLPVPVTEAIPLAAQKKYEDLLKLPAAKFDRLYLSGLVDSHKKAIKLFERGFQNAEDADLKKWTGKNLAVLKEHLEHAQALEKAFRERRASF